MRAFLIASLWAAAFLLSACTLKPNQDQYVTTQELYCRSHPAICNAHIVRVYPTIQLPDLTVDPPNCARGTGLRGTIRNLGPVAVPGPIDFSSTVFAGATGPQTSNSNTGSVGLAAAGDAQQHDRIQVYFGPIDTDATTQTVFEVYVNPPEPGYPNGKIFESNLQNNAACAVCQCDANGCTTQQLGLPVCGGP